MPVSQKHRAFDRVFKPDPRDFQLGTITTTRRRRRWRMPAILDQGDTPHCVGFAWDGFLICGPVVNQQLNGHGIYRYAQFVDEWAGEAYEGTSVRAGAKVLRDFSRIVSFAFTRDLDTALAYLLEAGPLVAGTDWWESMCFPDQDGVIEAGGGELLGGHAYLLTGYDDYSGLIEIANSWGPDWGVIGFAWIHRDDFEALLHDEGEVCAAKENRSKTLLT